MKLKLALLSIPFIVFMLLACSENSTITPQKETIEIEVPEINSIKILALGDSYTIGQSVCDTCRFPEQLKSQLLPKLELINAIELEIIAQTGWTTSNLISAIDNKPETENFDLVTLLIGVNNQYQGKAFSIYSNEFPQLINTAISKAKSNKTNVIVISIPDYAFTPVGKEFANVSEDIDTYNSFAENYCLKNNISFLNITDITRLGFTDPTLVASDGLHPSELAYAKFVERLLPVALEKLKKE